VVREDGDKQELAEIVGKRQWFNVPVPTSSVAEG